MYAAPIKLIAHICGSVQYPVSAAVGIFPARFSCKYYKTNAVILATVLRRERQQLIAVSYIHTGIENVIPVYSGDILIEVSFVRKRELLREREIIVAFRVGIISHTREYLPLRFSVYRVEPYSRILLVKLMRRQLDVRETCSVMIPAESAEHGISVPHIAAVKHSVVRHFIFGENIIAVGIYRAARVFFFQKIVFCIKRVFFALNNRIVNVYQRVFGSSNAYPAHGVAVSFKKLRKTYIFPVCIFLEI